MTFSDIAESETWNLFFDFLICHFSENLANWDFVYFT